MNALEKAKLALRKHLLENKEKVVADLAVMRKKSDGHDVFAYVENLSSAYSLENITISKEVLYDYSFIEVDCYRFVDETVDDLFYSLPSNHVFNEIKKDSEVSSESFFYY